LFREIANSVADRVIFTFCLREGRIVGPQLGVDRRPGYRSPEKVRTVQTEGAPSPEPNSQSQPIVLWSNSTRRPRAFMVTDLIMVAQLAPSLRLLRCGGGDDVIDDTGLRRKGGVVWMARRGALVSSAVSAPCAA